MNGALCYSIKARVLDVQRDKAGRVGAIEKALTFDINDTVLRDIRPEWRLQLVSDAEGSCSNQVKRSSRG